MTPVIRRLTVDDAEACVRLRRAMLLDTPGAFLASPGDDLGSDPEKVRERLEASDGGATFGAFTPKLVGSVGLFRERHAKAAHKATIWGMYVQPEARGQGLGRALLVAVLEHARGLEGVTQVGLSVSEVAPEARRLYASAGFRLWGTEPGAILLEGKRLDEHHLWLAL